MKVSTRYIRVAMPIASLASIAAGSTALWGWPVASMTVGALVWFDLFVMGRDLARAERQAEPTQ